MLLTTAWYADWLLFSSHRRTMVRCSECGLLALTWHHGTFEATEQLRERGQLPVDFSSGVIGITAAYPVCCGGALDFGGLNCPEPKELSAIFQADRECQKFVKWHRGLSPKDHHDMSILEKVRAEQSQWRNEDLRWQKQVEALAETRHQENRSDLAKLNSKTNTVAIVAAIATVASAIIALFALLK